MSINPERINIKDLTIEEPEKESEWLFDPERDISKDQWETIKRRIEELRRDPYKLETDEDRLNFLESVSNFKILVPEKINEINLEDGWKKAKQLLDHGGVDDAWDLASFLTAVKNLSPEKYKYFREEYEIDDINWRDIKQELKGEKEAIGNTRDAVINFTELAKMIKVIAPEKVLELKLDIAERILEMYYYMSVLSAEKIEFTKDGEIRLVKQAELDSEAREMPEKRDF